MGDTPQQLTGGGAQAHRYGLTTWAQLFTHRQIVSLTTFSDLVAEARERIRHDIIASGIADDGKSLHAGGTRVRQRMQMA